SMSLANADVVALSNGSAATDSLGAGQTGMAVLNSTPFYAEGGGQVGDRGELAWQGGRARVVDTTKQNDLHLHHVEVIDGKLSAGSRVTAAVDDSERRRTQANHTATHLMHAALKKVLGSHVGQAGSVVDAARLRFDFT